LVIAGLCARNDGLAPNEATLPRDVSAPVAVSTTRVTMFGS
jgi:hypothetical protein